MILESLQGEDFLKFRRISLGGLPEAGVIGIRGPNESGKTSLGEAITFALFGRTLRLPPKGRRGAIRWGCESARVSLVLRASDGARYTITRELDTSGGYSAEVLRADGEAEGELLAKGPAEVDQIVRDLLGFDFEAFRYAFYLGQKEVDLLLGAAESGGALERMIGVRDLEKARDRAVREHEGYAERARELGIRIQLQEELIEELSRDDKELELVSDEVAAQTEALREVEQTRAQLEGELEEAGASDRAAISLAGLIERVELLALTRSLGGRIAVLEAEGEELMETARRAREAEEKARQLQREHRMFSDSLSELEEFVRAKGAELMGEAGGEPPPKRADKAAPRIASETEMLQKVAKEIEQQLGSERSHLAELEGRTRRSRISTILAALLGPALALGLKDLRGLFVLPLAVMAYFMLRIQRARADDARERVERGEIELVRIQDEISDVKKVGKACDRFLARNKAALLEGLRTIGSTSLLKMAERLEERFPQFWNAPETFLEGYGGVLQEAVEQRRKNYERCLDEAREAAGVADSCRGRVESLMRLAGSEGAGSTKLEGVRTEGLQDAIERDLVSAERLLIQLEKKGVSEIPQARGAIEALFDALDPEKERGRPDCEGFSRILRGQPPPGASSGDDPWPWARRQAARAREVLGDRISRVSELEQALESLRDEASRIRAGVEVLESRRRKIAETPTAPEERVRQLEVLRADHREADEAAAVRELLADCLGATASRLRSRLLPMIAEYAARMLPRITGGKYAEVRISSEGEIQFFAPDAGEYVSIDALSGGARDQFLLALRLAFAAAVVKARAPEGTSPFLFLDEPLASSDEERGRAFLELLGDRADAFRQVFVVTHRHAGDETYDRLLRLSPDEDVLEDAGAEAARAQAS